MSDEYGLIAYDLAPGGFRGMIPRVTPLGERRQHPFYTPRPLAPGMVRVVLSRPGADGEPADFELYDPDNLMHKFIEPHRVFDVQADRFARWSLVREAFYGMADEIEGLISASATKAAHSSHSATP